MINLFINDSILKVLSSKKSGALLFKPAVIDELNNINKDLSTFHLAEISGQLLDFYLTCGGMAYNGIEIFSVKPDGNTKTGYKIPNLIDENLFLSGYYKDYEEYKEDFLFFGKSDEEYLIASNNGTLFQVVAREDLMVMEEYDTLKDFFTAIFEFRL